VDELLGYFQQAAQALDYLHETRSPTATSSRRNMLLKEGRVLLADLRPGARAG